MVRRLIFCLLILATALMPFSNAVQMSVRGSAAETAVAMGDMDCCDEMDAQEGDQGSDRNRAPCGNSPGCSLACSVPAPALATPTFIVDRRIPVMTFAFTSMPDVTALVTAPPFRPPSTPILA